MDKVHCCLWLTKSYQWVDHWHGFSFLLCSFTGITNWTAGLYKSRWTSLLCTLKLKMNQFSSLLAVAWRVKILVKSTESSPRKRSCSGHCASQRILSDQMEKCAVHKLAVCSVTCTIWHEDQLEFPPKEQKLSLANLS